MEGGGSVQVRAYSNPYSVSRSGSLTIRTTSGLEKTVSVSQRGIATQSNPTTVKFTNNQSQGTCLCEVTTSMNVDFAVEFNLTMQTPSGTRQDTIVVNANSNRGSEHLQYTVQQATGNALYQDRSHPGKYTFNMTFQIV